MLTPRSRSGLAAASTRPGASHEAADTDRSHRNARSLTARARQWPPCTCTASRRAASRPPSPATETSCVPAQEVRPLNAQQQIEAVEVVEQDGYRVFFPNGEGGQLGQDEEWCEVELDGDRKRIRFHDYHEVYSIPGLYEQIFYDKLECASPSTVRSLLEDHLQKAGFDPAQLKVLDVGAGNGIVGEELAEMGARSIVGVDIIEEAAEAAERDRPGIYDDYYVVDLTDIPPRVHRELRDQGFNSLVSVASLGFGDIPPLAFAEAFNLVATPGWIAFNIKEDFLDDGDPTGFNQLIRRMLDEGTLEEQGQRKYRHRLSTSGEPLHYCAIVAQKSGDVPLEWVRNLE